MINVQLHWHIMILNIEYGIYYMTYLQTRSFYTYTLNIL